MPCTVGQTTGPIHPWIETRHGQPTSDIEQVLTTRELPALVAEKLGVEPGAMGVEVRRTFRLATGRVAQMTTNLHSADRLRWAMKLKRTRAA